MITFLGCLLIDTGAQVSLWPRKKFPNAVYDPNKKLQVPHEEVRQRKINLKEDARIGLIIGDNPELDVADEVIKHFMQMGKLGLKKGLIS